ncbi:sigma factor [Nesterenkonia sandarakina]|uniref:DNA-directed RNA polymerase specialized sigma24 family protein n=1 Tax=Nesterenkonia sandarakina TaxID=272918 RepID=A0A7Z0J2F7_9MICC|nr:sigma factor [Nesterenkonia sandarakina]NYJ16147.1 DNA-directed RNA polymerase specialized sigma24 family protein [Nesterenkonia sandarakina]
MPEDHLDSAQSLRQDPADRCAELLVKIQAGDEQSFVQLYRDHGRILLLILRKALPEKAAAERALRGVFAQIWAQCASFDPAQTSGSGWITRLAREQILNQAKNPVPGPEVPEPRLRTPGLWSPPGRVPAG